MDIVCRIRKHTTPTQLPLGLRFSLPNPSPPQLLCKRLLRRCDMRFAYLQTTTPHAPQTIQVTVPAFSNLTVDMVMASQVWHCLTIAAHHVVTITRNHHLAITISPSRTSLHTMHHRRMWRSPLLRKCTPPPTTGWPTLGRPPSSKSATSLLQVAFLAASSHTTLPIIRCSSRATACSRRRSQPR